MWGVVYGPGGPEQEELTPGEIARIMFPALIVKGPHAYGWMSWRGGDHPIEVRKYPGRCDTTVAARRIRMPRDAKWMVGHTRLATHGSPRDNRNNHPIPHGGVVGVHNGVLRGYDDILAVTGRQDPLSEVDSEAIFAAVNRWGAVDGLRRVQGNMVTVFVDQAQPQIVNIARSYGRPLVMAWTKAGSLVFASEDQALDRLREAGVWLSEYTTLLGDYRLLRVAAGNIIERTTYWRAKPETTVASAVMRLTDRDLRDYVDTMGSSPHADWARRELQRRQATGDEIDKTRAWIAMQRQHTAKRRGRKWAKARQDN